MSWTEPQDTALKVAMGEGCTFSQAAKVLWDLFNVTYSRSAVGGRCSRLGIRSENKPLKCLAAVTKRKPKAPKTARAALRLMPEIAPLEERLADVIPLHIALRDLTDANCKWPYGDGPFTFCGCQTFGGGPYCEPHDALSRRSH
jgi:hypothetical protein